MNTHQVNPISKMPTHPTYIYTVYITHFLEFTMKFWQKILTSNGLPVNAGCHIIEPPRKWDEFTNEILHKKQTSNAALGIERSMSIIIKKVIPINYKVYLATYLLPETNTLNNLTSKIN